MGLVQKGVIELHVWGSTTRDLSRPDRMVFDLDPDPLVPWREVMAATRRVRERVEELGLDAFLKTSGGKGLHVYARLPAGASYDDSKALARALAEGLARRFPERVVASMNKSLRGGRVLVDWSQNDINKTTVAPYSPRARDRPTVSTPLTWEEVEAIEDPESVAFTAADVLERVAAHGDLFAPVLSLRQQLPR